MDVYFVRHGETVLNRMRVHQSPGTPLSVVGQEQAGTVAELLRVVNPDLLLTSEYTRAIETARVIGMRVGLQPQTNGLVYEIVRPSSLYGKSHFHPKTLWYVFFSYLKRRNQKWHFEDAENFSDIENRAKNAVKYLESLNGKNQSIVVVSHAIFIQCMVSYMSRRTVFPMVDTILNMLQIKRLRNTDIVHVKFDSENDSAQSKWRIGEGI